MQKPPQRSITEILDAYRDYLLSKVSKVRIFGEADERELKNVFVELSIVEQRTLQQHAEFLGMMDSAMRKRFDPFADEDGDTKSETSELHEKGSKRRVKPDELLRRRSKAIITGAPGCGKTTLLKHLALQALGEEKRLAVWLELKAIDKPLFAQAEKLAARDGNLIVLELWLKHLKSQLSLTDAEIKLLRAHWQEKFRANEIAVLFDGFDELQNEAIELSLNNCIREFVSTAHDNALLITTRPYAQQKLGKERLQELEIEPLNQRQIEAFLNCYYPNDAAIKSLLKTLREGSSLRNLLHVPLLLGVILRLHRENRFTDERLKLYETIITDLVHELDRSKSVIRQFKINDERLRLDFLKSLAFERLLRDPLHEEEQEMNRLIFSYDLLKEKARVFLARERSSHHPRDLADDALATPLLHKIGVDTLAFTHLTLQEYLAARAFAAFYKANEFEGLQILCRAYHNPTVVEMDLLPMMLGATTNAEKLYAEIERWPDSLAFANLRLRARGLAYLSRPGEQLLARTSTRLLDFVQGRAGVETPYCDIIFRSFSGLSHQTSDYVAERVISLIYSDDASVRCNAVKALGHLGGERAVTALLEALEDLDDDVSSSAAAGLGRTGNGRALLTLAEALTDRHSAVRMNAAKALGQISDRRAVNVLLEVVKDKEPEVGREAAKSIARLGDEQLLDMLIEVLKHKNRFARHGAVIILGEWNDERAMTALLGALHDRSGLVREAAASALVWVREPRAVDALLGLLKDKNYMVRFNAALALGQAGEARAAAALMDRMIEDDQEYVRWGAALAVGWIGDEASLPLLREVLRYSEDYLLRHGAANALKNFEGEEALATLLEAMEDADGLVRSSAAFSLGRPGNKAATDTLLRAVMDEDDLARRSVVRALGQIGEARAAPALLNALSDVNRDIRADAGVALVRIGGGALAEWLMQALSHENAFVRQKAAQAVGYYAEGEQVLHELARLAAEDRSDEVRRVAREAHARYKRKLELFGHFIAEGPARPLSDNESRELFLVGEAFKVAAEAGHIFRPTPNSDWGIDGEIEFKNERGEASGQRVYLQLKSGDSYLRTRKRDGKEIFTINKPRHAEYWRSHAYPVLLVILNSSGQIRWMNVTEYLQRPGTNSRQIEFQGEPFTAESVKKMRARFAR